jgi:4'-phosphopantetheinyl transferase
VDEAVKVAKMWQLPASTLTIAPGETHLWRALCVPAAIDFEQFATQLTAEEMMRAGRFATATLQRRYLQAHSLLHTLLAAYTQSSSRRCELAYQSNGKPYLRAPQLHPPLAFNMSHSGEMVVIALMRGSEVGVDVELLRPLDDLEAMVATTCSEAEQAYLAALPLEKRLTAFYRLWTRKEAWLKLRGIGLSGALKSVEVHGVPQGVTLLDIPLADHLAGEYAGAVALPVMADSPPMRVWDAFWQ